MAFTTVPQAQVPQLIADAANANGLDPQLLLQQALAESSLNQTAKSSAGAIGVMQLEPATAAGLGVNPYDTAQNIQGGAAYMAQLLDQYGGDQQKALAAYNAGPTRVNAAIAANGDSWLSALPSETQNYVAKILGSVSSSDAQVSFTPDSVTSGIQFNLADLAGGIDPNTILLLTGLAIGGYFAVELLTDSSAESA